MENDIENNDFLESNPKLTKLERVRLKMEALKEVEKKYANEEKKRERKQRTSRLITLGAIFEKHFGSNPNEDYEQFIEYLAELHKRETTPHHE